MPVAFAVVMQVNLQMQDKLTPTYWWKRAKKVRTLAEQMTDLRIRETLLRSALDYEILAMRAEERWASLEQQLATRDKTASLRAIRLAQAPPKPAKRERRSLPGLHQGVWE